MANNLVSSSEADSYGPAGRVTKLLRGAERAWPRPPHRDHAPSTIYGRRMVTSKKLVPCSELLDNFIRGGREQGNRLRSIQ